MSIYDYRQDGSQPKHDYRYGDYAPTYDYNDGYIDDGEGIPEISTQPRGGTTTVGVDKPITVRFTNAGALQWYVDESPHGSLISASEDTLDTSAFGTGLHSIYCEGSNAVGTVVTRTAKLAVNPA